MRTLVQFLAVVSLLTAGAAWGDDDHGHRGGRSDQARGHTETHGEYGAPEPVTLAALAAGAGVAGVAAWRSRRKR